MKRSAPSPDGPDRPLFPPPASCQLCRSRKLKCDRGNPCFNCSSRNLNCVSSSGKHCCILLPPVFQSSHLEGQGYLTVPQAPNFYADYSILPSFVHFVEPLHVIWSGKRDLQQDTRAKFAIEQRQSAQPPIKLSGSGPESQNSCERWQSLCSIQKKRLIDFQPQRLCGPCS